MTEQVDVVVVGLGVAGEMVGGELARAGLSVVGVEAGLVGGECPYWGCVPSKMMIRAGNLLAETARVDGLAGRASAAADWAPVARRIRQEATADWDDTVAARRFTDAGGTLVRGRGVLAGEGTVRVGDRAFAAGTAVVLTAGSAAVVPPLEGLAGTPYWTNREAIEAEELPASLVVLGGGAIGLELAQVFARFGVPVTVVEAGERILSVEEPEASALLAEQLGAEGLTLRIGARAQRVSHDAGGFRLVLSDGSEVTGERLLVATGRKPDLAGLGVETVGLDPSARTLAVDDRLRAGDRLWAAGDITGRGMFTHVATYQAQIVVREILGRPGAPADYRALPRVTFTDPEVGAVGLTEAQARAAGGPVTVGLTELPSTTRGWIHGPGNAGFLKLVADPDRQVLIGATSAGPSGGEVLGALAVAVKAEVPLETLREMIYAYPTFHRGISDALSKLH